MITGTRGRGLYLNPQESTDEAFPAVAFKIAPGQHAYRIVLDPDDGIWETDETNNVLEGKFEVPNPDKK